MSDKSKSKKVKSRGEVSFFDKTFFSKKVLGIVLAVIMIASASTGIVASSISDQNSYVESETVSDEDAVKAMSVEDLINGVLKTFEDPKMESVIAHIINVSETRLEEIKAFAESRDLDIDNDKIRVVIELTDEDYSVVEKYSDVTVEITYKNLVQALVPISEIKSISKEPSVQFIRKPLKAYPAAITSEGVGVINADELHAMGIKGDGVKIAVINGGFKGYATNPEIPSANIAEVKSFRVDGDIEADSEHGAACAEIVLDVAPNASLYLFNFETELEFEDAVNYAISKDVDIISCSMGWHLGPFDGTWIFCEIVNNAHANGIFFAGSAGNSAEHHWEGWFNDPDNDGWHNFQGTDWVLNIEAPYDYEDPYYCYPFGISLSWDEDPTDPDDDWPHSDQDYDLYLVTYLEGEWWLVEEAWSENPQTGMEPPIEWFSGWWCFEFELGPCGVAIRKYDADIDVHFELYTDHNYNKLLEYNVPSSSLITPADAEGVVTVGATYWSDDSLESFSSQGPTNDGRIKPDVTAPDGVSTYAYGSGKFYGTSASAPHVAGAAALLLSDNHSLTADQLQSTLEETAVDLGVPGKDNLFGSGRINLVADWNPWDDDCDISDVEISLAEWHWATSTPKNGHTITDAEISLLEYQWATGDVC